MDQEQERQITIITYQDPIITNGQGKKQKVTDVIDLQNIFKASQQIIHDGVIKYLDTELSLQCQEIPLSILQREEGEPNNKSQIYYTQEIRSLDGVIVNKSTKTNKNNISMSLDTTKTVGVYLCLQNMKFGEKSVFKVSPTFQKTIIRQPIVLSDYNLDQPKNFQVINFVTQSQAQQEVQPQDQIYIIQFIDYKNCKKNLAEYTLEERLQKICFFREQASNYFGQDNYPQARVQYNKILTFSTSIPKDMKGTWTPQQIENVKIESVRAYTNSAVCGVKQQLWLETKKDILEAIKLDPQSYKANLILARCYFELENYLDARDAFEKLLVIPDNDQQRLEIHQYLDKLNKKVQNPDLRYQKKVAKHIILKMSEEDPDEILRKKKNKYEQIEKAKKQQDTLSKVLSGSISNQDDLQKL